MIFMKKYQIAVVGGSISGCCVAAILYRLGIDVTVFEKRSIGAMVDRGAGLALPKELVSKLIELDLFDQNFLKFGVEERIFFTIDPETHQAHELTRQPFNVYVQHWGSIYQNLLKRVPENIIHYDTEITDITSTSDKKVKLTTNHQDTQTFDLVIFADGYNSLGRQYLFPDSKLKSTNCIAWRGISENISSDQISYLTNIVPFYLYEKGHVFFALIPKSDNIQEENKLTVTWLFYENLDENHPISRDNKAHENISPSAMTSEYINYLNHLAEKYLSEFPKEIILNTKKPYTQAILDAVVPSLFENNIALMGDAGILVRPHTASGATKALQDALYMKECLEQGSDIVDSFKRWNEERHKVSEQLFKLGCSLGELLVTNVPDWKTLDKESMDNLWQATIAGHNWYASK